MGQNLASLWSFWLHHFRNCESILIYVSLVIRMESWETNNNNNNNRNSYLTVKCKFSLAVESVTFKLIWQHSRLKIKGLKCAFCNLNHKHFVENQCSCWLLKKGSNIKCFLTNHKFPIYNREYFAPTTSSCRHTALKEPWKEEMQPAIDYAPVRIFRF